jgi:uncharacterized membrane protein
MVTGALVRHFMNIRFWFAQWLPAFSSTIFLGVVIVYWLTVPKTAPVRTAAQLSPEEIVHFKTVRGVVTQRCLPCHSATPTDDVWKTAPVGIMFDTPSQMKTYAPRMKDRVQISKTMPLGNKTQITDAERDLLGNWVDQGAPIDNLASSHSETTGLRTISASSTARRAPPRCAKRSGSRARPGGAPSRSRPLGQ